MKIIALIRTLNEADKIDACCQAYQFCDEILIADGGSTDGTIELALKYQKVMVRNYENKVQLNSGIWRNPDGPHLNFLYDWGRERGADWLISQDCDQRPNYYLKQNARSIMETTTKDFIMPVQIFLWGNALWFPNLSRSEQVKDHGRKVDDKWLHGIWAHRASINLKVIDKMPHYEFSLDGTTSIRPPDETGNAEIVDPPNCYIHFGWETLEETDAMIDYYKKSGLISEMSHPLKFGGPVYELKEWMKE